ncbi:CitMHS family transporter [Angelakisella massiliensis]|uniref:CitMHS family transporter n=1 Tax=Angelakisella massiliensis TaxID=1871018 RepID=UPI0008F88E9C|nr:citrate:proton symporter [Angelakisella massiliensis]
MYLAFLGFGMIVVFMALIMAKKLSPFTSLIIIPVLFGLLAGYGWDTLEYAMTGIKDVASTFAMMTFAILYFGVMLTAGMFDPMVDKVVSWCKGDPLKVLVGTAVLAAFVSLDGDGTTTVMICCTAMIPIYDRLKIKKIYLATLIILQNCIMNLIPWGGPTARVMSVMQLDAGEILAPLVPGMVLSAIYVIGVSYYLGMKERKRLGVTQNVENTVTKVEVSAEEMAWKRPKLILFNLLLTAAIIVFLVMGLASSAILFGVGTAIALVVNYPNQKVQRNVISSIAPDMINVVMMVLGAGVLMGVLNGPEDAGMSAAIAQLLVSIIPESLGRYFAIIIAFISAPGTYLLNNDAFYYGVLPPLAATAEAYGFTNLQIGFAALMGQAFHFLSPLVPFIYLLMDKTEITLAQYQGYIFKWCIGIFAIFMMMGFVTGNLPVL